MARLFNQREGLTASDDRLPGRVRTAFSEGPLVGIGISDEDFVWARRRFYELMDWDPETGVPGNICLQELHLADLVAGLSTR